MDKVDKVSVRVKGFLACLIIGSGSACTLNVDLHVTTDKPIALNVVIDKPIEVKLGADIAVTKLAPVNVDLAVTKIPPVQTVVKMGLAKSPPKPPAK